TGSTTHLLPRFFELPGDSPEIPVRYMLAVPAGQVAVNGNEGFMSSWSVPTPYDQYKHHLKVCIYDLTEANPANVTPHQGDLVVPTWTIIGPVVGFANFIQVKEFDGKLWL